MFIYAFEKDKKKNTNNVVTSYELRRHTKILWLHVQIDVTLFLILKNPNVWKWKMERDQVSKTQSSKPKDEWNWKDYCKIALRDALK